MSQITIPLPDETIERVRELALDVGMTPEEFLASGVEAWLEKVDREFDEILDDILEQNSELYRRLA